MSSRVFEGHQAGGSRRGRVARRTCRGHRSSRIRDAGQGAPQRGNPLGADGQAHPLPVRGHRQIDGEVPGVRAQRHPPHPAGQAGQRPTQQPRRSRARVLVTREQLHRQDHSCLSPADHVRTPATLALVVVGHPALLPAINLHIGGVHVDRHRTQQGLHPLRRQQGQHPLGRPGHAPFHRRPLLGVYPPGQTRRRGGTQPRHRSQQLTSRISAISIQPTRKSSPAS